MRRRTFLSAAMTGGAMTLAGPVVGNAATKQKSRYRERKRIDLHAHHIGPSYRDALTRAGITAIGGIPIPEWSPDLALKFMDAHGIAVQMLSVSDPGVQFLAPSDQPGLAQSTNDYAASVVKDHPMRFGAFAVLPLDDVQASRAEVTRALDTLKLDGVGLLSSDSAGRYLGDPLFESLLSDLNDRGAYIFVHPHAVTTDDMPSYQIPNFIAEYPFDTTRTFISLLFNGRFAQFPKIRWHFAHGGGTLPMLAVRLTALAGSAKQFGPLLGLPSGSSVLTDKSFEQAVHKSHFDTGLIGAPASLLAVEAMAGHMQMTFGSDWPFASRLYGPKGDPQPALSKAFSTKQRHAIDRLNGRKQFKRLQSFVPGS